MTAERFFIRVLVFFGLFALISFGYSLNSKATTTFPYRGGGSGFTANPGIPFTQGVPNWNGGGGNFGPNIYGPFDGYTGMGGGYGATCMAVGICPGGSYGTNYSMYADPYSRMLGLPGWGSGFDPMKNRSQTTWNMWGAARNTLSANPYSSLDYPSPLMGWAYGTGQRPGIDMVEGGTANILMHPPPPPIPSSYFGNYGVQPNFGAATGAR